VDEYYLGITKEWASRFSVNLFLIRGSYKTFSPLPLPKFISSNQQDIFTTEAGIDSSVCTRRKKVETSRKEFRYRANTPLFEFTMRGAYQGVFGSMYQYDKIFGQVSRKYVFPLGRCQLSRIRGQDRLWALPFMLLEIHPGNDIYYYAKHSFNLMNRSRISQ
jgi:hypothetical protein